MPESKRPDSRRRSPTTRPNKKGAATRGRKRHAPPVRSEPRVAESKPAVENDSEKADSITKSIAVAAEQQSEQRFGAAARRAAILAAVVCVLTLTIAGPVRTYFAQRTEMMQLKATEEQLREQIAELEQQKVKLADPAFITAQARERLGFVMPGDIPYQVQLPPTVELPSAPNPDVAISAPDQPWYTSLWQTIADEPRGAAPTTAPPEPADEPVPAPSPVPGG